MDTRVGWVSAVIIASSLVAAACQSKPSTDEIAAAIRQQLAAEQSSARPQQTSADLQKLYGQQTAPLWVMGSPVDARAALDVIRMAADHGLQPADYFEQDIARELDRIEKEKVETPADLASLDVLVTRALLALGHDVAFGRINPSAINQTWKSTREPADLTASLSQAAASGTISGWLDAIRPQHPHYAALQSELKRLRAAASTAGVEPAAATTDDGGELSVDARMRLLELNLERWRWLPDDFGATHVLVNIPAYRLAVHDQGQTPLTMRVIVGDPETRTPVFSGSMNTVVFSPYWNIPESIIEGEIAAVAARDPSYLRRNNIDILRVSKSGVEEINPARVNWDSEEELKGLSFRQRPGAQNALGHVKFLFPNKYNVYLHDTPGDRLFARPDRALSHGCVRLEKPEELAAFVFRGSTEWDQPKIREAMYSGTEKHVALKPAIPVHILYMTAWVDEAGTVRYSDDVYGYDAAQTKLDQRAAG